MQDSSENRLGGYFVQMLLISACLLLPDLSLAQKPEPVVITRTAVEASKYDRFAGGIHIQTSLESLQFLILESEAYPTWLHGCKKAQVLAGDLSAGKAYIYFIYDAPGLPWYLRFVPRPKDRDMVLKMVWAYIDGNLKVTLTNVSPEQEPGLSGIKIPNDPGLTTVNQVDVSWTFVPVEQGRIKVMHEMYIDPNHSGTDLGIMNRYVENMVQKSLENIRNRFHQ